MDGSNGDHSDSDSGESWTLLEPGPTHGDDAAECSENIPSFVQVNNETNIEKDEDTDGISVISDSDPETSLPCDISYNQCTSEDTHMETRPSNIANSQYLSLNPVPLNSNHTAIRNEDDFLGDNTGKHKTYVHRRNKRLSTVLNIIMLGSVITAAGVAIGHMWGVKNECSLHSSPSVNKILSNLYKLQEENSYLRSKLKELTLATNKNMQQKKMNLDKIPFKQQRCKKLFEEPLNNKNVEKVTKCIEMDNSITQKSISNNQIPEFEKEFLSDIDKLKNVYLQNKSWLDDEIARRLKSEVQSRKKIANNMKTTLSSITEEQKGLIEDSMKDQTDNMEPTHNNAELLNISDLTSAIDNVDETPDIEKKVTYADSLKSNHQARKTKQQDTEVEIDHNNHIPRKRVKKDTNVVTEILSDEEIQKDDRYVGPKTKLDKKKRDRQKLHKKQKRKNKYEQWEMKGGYLRDYDDVSLTSQDNEFVLLKPYQNHFGEDKNWITVNSYAQTTPKSDDKSKEKISKAAAGKNAKNEDGHWYDKRAALRNEARKKLEFELFGETSPNNAGWYFRRMQKREQCRAKNDNSTYKKLFKRNMNFKMKK